MLLLVQRPAKEWRVSNSPMLASTLATETIPSAALPRRFGRYALFDRIGTGGMADIFLARHKTDLGAARLCVVKQIRANLAADPSFSSMLVHEAKLAVRLSHCNVVQILDLGREDERLFIAMEYVEGFDLNDLLRRCSRAKVPLPFELGLHVVREALRGLDYAHRRTDDDGKPLGIVHRDVSPSNLLVSFEGEIKVCDFGIARANDAVTVGAGAHEIAEALRGKAGYMSPEHARGEPIDARSDVFAAGVVLWEVAAGRRMYKAAGAAGSLLDQARRAQIPDLPAEGLPHPERLRAIVARALGEDREARYPSAASMLRDLSEYAAVARLTMSPLALGDWLTKTFGEDIIEHRRARERALAALDRGAPLVVDVVRPAGTPSSAEESGVRAQSGMAALQARAPASATPAESATPAVPAPKTKLRAATVATVVVAIVALAAVIAHATHAIP